MKTYKKFVTEIKMSFKDIKANVLEIAKKIEKDDNSLESAMLIDAITECKRIKKLKEIVTAFTDESPEYREIFKSFFE